MWATRIPLLTTISGYLTTRPPLPPHLPAPGLNYSKGQPNQNAIVVRDPLFSPLLLSPLITNFAICCLVRVKTLKCHPATTMIQTCLTFPREALHPTPTKQASRKSFPCIFTYFSVHNISLLINYPLQSDLTSTVQNVTNPVILQFDFASSGLPFTFVHFGLAVLPHDNNLEANMAAHKPVSRPSPEFYAYLYHLHKVVMRLM